MPDLKKNPIIVLLLMILHLLRYSVLSDTVQLQVLNFSNTAFPVFEIVLSKFGP